MGCSFGPVVMRPLDQRFLRVGNRTWLVMRVSFVFGAFCRSGLQLKLTMLQEQETGRFALLVRKRHLYI